ncbi:MAG: hypothetical protein H6722_04970 [Sandaracinus sp.]|nr:hypothetical protein [Myxococcales bacterium]MCB9611790.1 hypothetical protein [Sandaracinus sp.]
MRQAYRQVIAVGLVTLAIAIGLLFVLPTSMGVLPEGMQTPIVAFELARSPAEIEAMFGDPGSTERAAWVAAMDLGNQIDFGFLLAYGAVLFLVSRALRRESGRTTHSLGERLAFVGPLADVFENVQLLEITSSLGTDYRDTVGRLMLYTWIKWIAIALVMLSWAPTLLTLGRPGRIAAGTIVITALATASAVVVRGIAAEAMSLGVVLSLVCILVLAFVRARKPDEAPVEA